MMLVMRQKTSRGKQNEKTKYSKVGSQKKRFGVGSVRYHYGAYIFRTALHFVLIEFKDVV